ncbi:MAG: type III-B CRISPR module RAMP protein Cmr6 [Bacteroidia bacterium]|nr:type III-B CRISPR module RAMP protein Cmr6 [Bacteroidia bacterium]
MQKHANAGWLFYRAYYRDIDFTKTMKDERNRHAFEAASLALTKVRLSTPYEDPLESLMPGLAAFEATTLYPGLLIGSGYQHETGREGEVKLGFFFDHTLGLPIIPGSSVKGGIRSAFGFPDLIRHLLGKPDLTDKQVEELAMDIFEGKDSNAKYVSKEQTPDEPEYKSRPMSTHDAFMDGIILDQEGEEGILALDFLTPHKPTDGKYGQFKNPIPLNFLKVRAGVKFRFRFRVNDCQRLGVTAKDKLQLFEKIILSFGLGAKTAVGYGQLMNANREVHVEKTIRPAEGNPNGGTTSPTPGDKGNGKPETPGGLPNYTSAELRHIHKQGKHLIGEVRDNTGGQLKAVFMLEGKEAEAVIKYPASSSFPPGTRIKIKIADPGNPDRNVAPVFGFGGKV